MIMLFLYRPLGQAVKTPPSHGGIMGSNPVGVTKKNPHQHDVDFSSYKVIKRLNDITLSSFYRCITPYGRLLRNRVCIRTQFEPSYLRRTHSCKQVRAPCYHGFNKLYLKIRVAVTKKNPAQVWIFLFFSLHSLLFTFSPSLSKYKYKNSLKIDILMIMLYDIISKRRELI